jgi:hypothetical protein
VPASVSKIYAGMGKSPAQEIVIAQLLAPAAGGRMGQLFSNAASGLAAAALKVWTALVTAWQTTMAEQVKHYQPELHYMRGPGPKWREKHACQRDSTVRR